MRDLFKFFKNDKTAVLFNNSTIDYYRIYDENIRKSLNNYFNEGKDSTEAIDILKSVNIDDNSLEKKENKKDKDNKIILQKLSIIVTNGCNLACHYCYAGGGNYGLKVENVTNVEAKKIVDYFTDKFDRIQFLQFFGGEPLLNPSVIKYICEYFDYLKEIHKTNYIPKYGITTNGTQVTEASSQLMKKYNFVITISIDGNEIINDSLRTDKFGNGTFNILKEKYSNLISADININNIGFECTYTNKHIENNISIVDLFKFFKDEFGKNITHITTVCIGETNSLSLNHSKDILNKYIEEAVKYTFNSIIDNQVINSSSIIVSMLERLVNKRRIDYICPAGLSNLNVSKSGNITPCFVFTGSNVTLGNLNTEISELLNNDRTFQEKYNQKNKDANCNKCWAKNLCSSCFTAYGANIDDKDRTCGADVMCETILTIIKAILLNLAEIKCSDEKWSILEKVIARQDKTLSTVDN